VSRKKICVISGGSDCEGRGAPRNVNGVIQTGRVMACFQDTRNAIHVPRCSPPPPGHSWLDGNELTALDVGLFDKNPALKLLYVDEGGPCKTGGRSGRWEREREGCTVASRVLARYCTVKEGDRQGINDSGDDDAYHHYFWLMACIKRLVMTRRCLQWLSCVHQHALTHS
jgi:hypothetical protein